MFRLKQLGLLIFILFIPSLIILFPDIASHANDSLMPFAEIFETAILYPISISGNQIPIVLMLLTSGAIFFTLRFGFVNIRFFPLAIRIVSGKFKTLIEPGQESTKKKSITISPFKALATAVSGTVGLGNIAMVAVAISIGGPGATFWMILAGLLGMSTKFVECTLGVKYRIKEIIKTTKGNEEEIFYGGPMYYLSKGLAEKGWHKTGKILAGIFAVFCVGASFGGGNAFQTNQASAQIISRFALDYEASGLIIGITFAILVGIVIIGGITRIAEVTGTVVPFMAALYLIACIFILCSNYSLIDNAFNEIITGAFSPRATISGGFATVMIQGFRRAAFSNEAGAGSASIAHSAAHTKYPATEGIVSLLEPFIDTVVICTMTALIIVIFNLDQAFHYGDVINGEVLLFATNERIGGAPLTSTAFESAIPGSSYALVFVIVLFAFSTIISWFYYGSQAWAYLFGTSEKVEFTYKIIFLIFSILGASVTLEAVIKFSDAMILALVFPNMIGLLFLYPKVKEELDRFKNILQEGKDGSFS